MALFYQHNINETTRLGIWRIEEPESFFLQKVPLQRTISHPHKRLQHLAGRWLLQYLFPDFPYSEILIADTRKPYLPYEQYHFSISHCTSFAAAIVSSQQRVGIDIEVASPKIETIAHKFLHGQDVAYMRTSQQPVYPRDQLLALMWSAKETLFKWYSLGSIDFKQHLQLRGPLATTAGGQIIMPFVFKKNQDRPVAVNGRLFNQLALTWCAT